MVRIYRASISKKTSQNKFGNTARTGKPGRSLLGPHEAGTKKTGRYKGGFLTVD